MGQNCVPNVWFHTKLTKLSKSVVQFANFSISSATRRQKVGLQTLIGGTFFHLVACDQVDVRPLPEFQKRVSFTQTCWKGWWGWCPTNASPIYPVQYIQSSTLPFAPRVTRAFLPSSMICIAWKNTWWRFQHRRKSLKKPRGLAFGGSSDKIWLMLICSSDPATGWKPLPHEQLIVTFHSQILHTRDLGNSGFKLIHFDPRNWGSKVSWQFYAHPLRMPTGNP